MKTKHLLNGLFCFTSIFGLSLGLVSCGQTSSSEVATESFAITLNFNDGVSRNEVLYVKKGTKADLPTGIKREGYSFVKWVDDNNNEIQNDFVPTSDLTLKAVWTTGTCLVTFHANYSDGQDITQYIEYGSFVTSPPSFTRTGFEIDYYSTISEENENAQVDFASYAIKGDFEFYVIWRDASIKQYTITITAGAYDGAPEATVLKVDDGNTIAKSNKAWKLTRDGYDLAGFTIVKPSDGKTWSIDDYNNIDSLLPDLIKLPYLPEGNTTIYAVWTIQQYVVVWNINYTDSSYQYGVFKSDKILSNENVERPSNDPTRQDYDFIGWYTSALDGKAVDFSSPVSIRSNTGYYAHWKHNLVETKRFQAEYVSIDSTKEYFGYSGSVKGQKCIIKDGGMVGTVDVDNYPTNSKLTSGNGYYVSYQYEKGDVLKFDFTSDQEGTAVLQGNLCAEYEGGATFSNKGDYAVAFRVNGTELTYSVTIGQVFQLVTIGQISLLKGNNSIEIEILNSNPVGGGTYRAAGFNTDYIQLTETSATTSWSPVYDNLEHIK